MEKRKNNLITSFCLDTRIRLRSAEANFAYRQAGIQELLTSFCLDTRIRLRSAEAKDQEQFIGIFYYVKLLTKLHFMLFFVYDKTHFHLLCS